MNHSPNTHKTVARLILFLLYKLQDLHGVQQQTAKRKNRAENSSTDTIVNIRVTNKVARSAFFKDMVVLSLLIPMGFQRETGR